MSAKRKILTTALVLLSFAAILWLVFLKNGISGRKLSEYGISGRKLSEYGISEEEMRELTKARTLSEKIPFESLVFNGEKLFFDEKTNGFLYSLNENDDSAKNPKVIINEKPGKNTELAVVYKELDGEYTENAEKTQLVFYNDKEYYPCTLSVTTLPVMQIICDKEITRFETVGKVRLYDNRKNVRNRLIDSDAIIHVRGKSSAEYPKKGYKIEFFTHSAGNSRRKSTFDVLGLKNDDDWILYAGYNDPEKIRNVFSSKLWSMASSGNNDFGLHNATEYKYIELFINSEYHGLYAIGYPINFGGMGLSDTGNAETSDYIYKKLSWQREEDIDFSKPERIDSYEISGGPKILNGISGIFWKPLEDLCGLLLSEDTTCAEIRRKSDMRSAIDAYLFCAVTQCADHANDDPACSDKNMLFIEKYTKDGYVTVYAPWDLDLSWGNVYMQDAKNNTLAYGFDGYYKTLYPDGYFPQLPFCAVSSLIKKGDGEILSELHERYDELRKTVFSEENINSLLDGYENDIFGSGAFSRDKDRWEDGSFGSASEGLEKFRMYVMGQLEAADRYSERDFTNVTE